MKREMFISLVAALLAACAGSVPAYDALQGPTELRYWDETRAYPGYTFFGVMGTTYLIDMQGRIVHSWPIGTNPHLLDNGHVLDASKDDPSGFGGFTEVDWDGATAWSYTESRSNYHPHHDFIRIYNSKLGAYTTLYIANKDYTSATLIAAGANPARTPATGAQLDTIVEVDMSGNVVWEWAFFDHIIQDFDAAKPNYVGAGKTIADYPNRLDINLSGHNLKDDWLHCNSLDYNAALGQIVVNSVQGEFYVIDHDSTFVAGNPATSIANAASSAGDFLYRFGDPMRYGQGTPPAILEDWTQSTHGTKQLGGAHHISWIAPGLEGAGNLMIFNNAEYLSEHAAQSEVFEINPFLNAAGVNTGSYVNPPDAGYTTMTFAAVTDKTPKQQSKQIVWNYRSQNSQTLSSTIGCGAQRLPNGNTLVCADTYGYISEVTSSGVVVWEYIVPVSKNGIVQQTGDKLPMVISIFRAYRYGADHPALSGRTLTPGNTIAGRSVVDNPYAGQAYQALQRPTELQYWDSVNAGNGYTLFAAQGNSYLIDMQGQVVNQWALGTNPRLLENGHILDAATSSSGRTGFRELDWDGKTAWEYYESRSGYHPHDDFARIFDPKLNAYATLYIAAKDLTHVECIAAGCDPADGPYDGAQADAIMEVDMSGNIVWEWCFFDHGIQDMDAAKANYVGAGKTIANYPGKLNLNLPGRPLRSGWPSGNSLDYNQALDQIVINSMQGEFYIINRGGTFVVGNPTASIAAAAGSAGDFLYRFGDPARYGAGNPPSVSSNWENATNGNKQIGASNNAQWIASGLPGAGHLLVFNSNQYLFTRTPQSYIFEINPFLNSSGTDTGAYVNPPTAGYNTWTFDKDAMKSNQLLSKQVVWKYGTLSNLTLFSPFGSGAQRLSNGNTLICASATGYMVEVTSNGAVVWEYINPVTAAGVVKTIGDCLPMTNATLRAHRYAPDFAGFLGKDMTAGPTITETAANAWSMLKLPDTGQTQSFTTTFGEDADYIIHPPSLTDNGNGTVTDNVTGLIWQKADGGEMTWEAATTYAIGLTLDGYSDWRLPTAHEAFSILNHGTINPALNTSVFTASAAEYWWTQDTLASDATRVWSANAGGGIGPHPKSETISAGGTKRFHPRCVRGANAPAGASPIHHAVNNGDGTVTDSDTGLMWQKGEAPAPMTWEAALQYAEGLTLAGHSDWRLPNIKELHSLNDETMTVPSLDRNYFPGAAASLYGSSTSMFNTPALAWTLDFQFGITSYADKTTTLVVRCVRQADGVSSSSFIAEFARIPGGSYLMGDHFGFVDPGHPSDEIPTHTVSLDPFYIGKTDVTCREYCDYLNAAYAQGLISISSNCVCNAGGTIIYSDTTAADSASPIQWSGSVFAIRGNRAFHPVTGIRWFGAIAYCNWLSARDGYTPCYNLTTGVCDFTKNGYRLPTEAEWEYAARGGQTNPYCMFPWGNDLNADGRLANWAASGDPYEAGDNPQSTPVGFYDGSLRLKSDYNWPSSTTVYQTRDGSNGYGLYDMSGNIWQWTNDWYGKDYYQYCVDNAVTVNPAGPAAGDAMPDGLPYHGLRGGNWFNGQDMYGHGRVANRDPGYYRGPGDPNGPWFHVGFRVARGGASPVAPEATLQPAGSGFLFTEGPAANASGDVFFSDVDAGKIYHWSAMNGVITTFRANSGGANGLYFDASGNLLACEGTTKRLTSTDMSLNVTALASQYNGAAFNKPNDLWIAPSGGVYFSDPLFGAGTKTQDGEHVYYLSPDRLTVTRVISDMTRPNGLIGTPDGKTLYAADYGASKVYRYTINTSNGALSGKTLFASAQCDGMTIDSEGNIYMAANSVLIYSPAGNQIGRIIVPEIPTNMTFGGVDWHTLFITARTSIYTIRMAVSGAVETQTTSTALSIAGTACSPVTPTSNDPVWITATVSATAGINSVTLTYDTGSGGGASGSETTVFQETMATSAVKPWTGAGCNNVWTVTAGPGINVEQRTQANHGTGNPCGLEFSTQNSSSALTAMIETASAFNASGASGYVEFWIQTLSLSGTNGWTFQLDAGSGYVTRLSELTGSNHGWQQYHYDLQAGELVAGLKMRFQFTGSVQDNRIQLDDIIVKTTSGSGSTAKQVGMNDDGAHQDGAAGDGRYGGQIPTFAAGTTVHYYVTAIDKLAAQATDPAGAPTATYSYTVASPPTTITQTVGLFLNTPEAFVGYTLLAPMHYTRTYLIDNDGQVVHTWDSAYEPGRTAYLLPNGHLVRECMILQGGPSTGGGEGGRIEEYDWDGNLVWEFDYYSGAYIAHHDFKVLPNGNILVLASEKKTYAEVIQAGFNPALLDTEIATKGYMLPDYVVEVQPTRPVGGNIVWEWHVWDHLIQDFDNTKSNYGVVANHPELVDVNGPGIKIPQFWNHMNSVGYNPDLDQMILSVRGNSELWVIDHQTSSTQSSGHTGGRYSKGGDLLYRWGNPRQYDAGTAGDQKLLQQHDTEWIPAGRPGAGNILIFNNGISRGYSTIDEITPPVDAGGNYSLTTGTAYGPSALTWTYRATNPADFCSTEISGAQRLPNGATLICEGLTGRLFEVTTAGLMVWEYICPVTDAGPMTQGDAIPADPRGGFLNAVFQADRYAPDYPGLAGKDLTPRGPIEQTTTPSQFMLVVTLDGLGSGTVTRQPLLMLYPQGTTLTLTAQPTTAGVFPSVFTHWTGDVVSTSNPLILVIDHHTTVTARFDLVPTKTGLVNHLTGAVPLTGNDLRAADINGDGIINTGDIVAIIQRLNLP
ncbi:MAG: DUF1566 domain-containing protein [Candidatus Sumerlaeota bacterium]|nr:DUF1566 domain-containing protein [Candidatus Sumerlaeota bacterium]